MPRLRRLLALTRAEWGLLIEASLRLALARLMLLLIPFRHIAHWLGVHQGEPTAPRQVSLALLRQVSWAVIAAARHVPFKAVCLPQAIAAKWMLRRRGVSSTLYLGVAKEKDSAMSAHAWLRVGDVEITGGGRMASRFTTVAHFT